MNRRMTTSLKTALLALSGIFILANTVKAQDLSARQKAIYQKVLVWHHNNPECGLAPGGGEFKSYIQLKKDVALVLVSCEIGTDQVNWMAYAAFGQGEEMAISQLSFAMTDGKFWTADIRIGQPEWNPQTRVLSTIQTQDMSESCGSQNFYKWRKTSFYLIRAFALPCDGEKAEPASPAPAAKPQKKNEMDWPEVFHLPGKSRK